MVESPGGKPINLQKGGNEHFGNNYNFNNNNSANIPSSKYSPKYIGNNNPSYNENLQISSNKPQVAKIKYLNNNNNVVNNNSLNGYSNNNNPYLNNPQLNNNNNTYNKKHY